VTILNKHNFYKQVSMHLLYSFPLCCDLAENDKASLVQGWIKNTIKGLVHVFTLEIFS